MPIMAPRLKRFLPPLLVVTWALAMGFAFWWFQLRWYQPLEDLTGDALFSAEQLTLSQTTPDTPIEVIHFYDANCPCTRFNTPHVQELITRYQGEGLRFRVLVPESAQLSGARQKFPGIPVSVATQDNQPVASPAALVRTQQLGAQYLGPWSPGAVCSTRSGDYVAQVLDQLLGGEQRNQTFQIARGCLCPWAGQSSAAHDGVST